MVSAPELSSKLKGSAKDRDKTGPLDLKSLRKMWDDARSLMQDARNDSELSRDYYDSIQLTGTERSALIARGQPPVVINRVQRAIDGIMGVVEQGRTDPRALMRNPPDDDQPQAQAPPFPSPQGGAPGLGGPPMGGPPMPGSNVVPFPPAAQGMPQPAAPPPAPLDLGDVATMALRFIKDTSHFDTTKMDVLENGLIEGCGAAIFPVSGKSNDKITPTQIRWEEFFFDPYSRRHDFKDARYMGIAKWIYADALANSADDKATKDAMEKFSSDGSCDGFPDQTWEDRPNDGGKSTESYWVDSNRKRIMVIELYHSSDGVWYRAKFYAGDILEYGKSAYLDDDNAPSNPIEAWSAYVNRKNERYGLVKSMRDIQDEINKRRSKAIHEINTRQIQQDDPNAPPIDVDDARKEAARADGVLPSGWKVVPRSDVVANNIEMMQEAKGELERMAAAPAILGRQSADASGRAQQIRQDAGMTELARVLGRHKSWERRAYVQMWSRARQFWKGPKWIRVTNNSEAPKYLQVNEPAPIDPMTGLPMGNPKNHIAQMDADIVLDAVPDTATLQQEVFNEFMELAKAYIGTQDQVPFKTLVKLSPLPNKHEIMKDIEADQAAAAQAAAPMQQIQQAGAVATVDKTKSETVKNLASAKKTEIEGVHEALQGHLAAHAAQVMPPGVADVANLPQNQPQEPTGP